MIFKPWRHVLPYHNTEHYFYQLIPNNWKVLILSLGPEDVYSDRLFVIFLSPSKEVANSVLE
jgi:hypothetical protein